MVCRIAVTKNSIADLCNVIILLSEEKRLDKITHNKTISKAIESYRIGEETKKYLRTLRID